MHPPQAPSRTALAPACAALFRDQDLPAPPVPAHWCLDLQPVNPFACASPGWPDEGSLETWAADWLQRPAPTRAWIGFTGHGIQSSAVRLCLAAPDAAVFMLRRWTEAFEQGPLLRRRIEGAFGLLETLLAELEATRNAKRWPAGKRLLLLDDDFGRQRWAWLAPGDGLDSLEADAMAYVSVLAALDDMKKQSWLSERPGSKSRS